MGRVRLSVALLPPEPAQTELIGVRRAVGCRSLSRLAPHITVVPPVNVRDERVDEAVAGLRVAASSCAALELTLGPAATFAPQRRVLYLAVRERSRQGALAALRARCAQDPLERPDERAFVPHLTLDEDASTEVVDAGIVALAAARWDLTFDRLVLLRHDEDERRWVPWHDVVLGPAVVRGRGGVELHLRRSSLPAPDLRRLLGEDERPAPTTVLDPTRWALEARSADGVLLAGAVGRHGAPEATVLVVDEAHRGQGIGTRLRNEAPQA